MIVQSSGAQLNEKSSTMAKICVKNEEKPCSTSVQPTSRVPKNPIFSGTRSGPSLLYLHTSLEQGSIRLIVSTCDLEFSNTVPLCLKP